ncbi:MAG: serine/threonine protein kinase [Acidobacteriota bacterium]|nr:MAG: serine/threonine protein kinase [Acidobacteriota bacterium]
MPEIDHNRVNEVLEEVLELDPSERRAFLSSAGLSSEVRQEVEQLLSFEEEAAASFNLAAIEFSHDFLESDNGAPVGQLIDVYKITGELGSGGMGAVFLAERTDGKLEQKVALKLLKRELNTSALRARFRQEREILASLEHPSIARLLNAGTTDEGIPFLAMEYVDGLPIDEFCDRHSLGLNERLEMFIKVCEAVGFAHRNLVVHRDLKPSNILVDKNGVPKLLDFGISKILSDEIGETDTATITRLGVMTPSYASPEQLQKRSVTTAADIYSLGVILYELMSGVRPFASKEDDLKAIYEAVVDEEPPMPSEAARTRNSDTGSPHLSSPPENDPPTSSAREKTASSSRTRTVPETHPVRWQQLKGDLDNIILKALKKEPDRRYSTAERLADDIERFLNGLPVLARPDTLMYRTGKFLRRNAFAAAAGFLILLAVLVGLGATLWQARQTEIEAERARSEAAKTKEALNFVGNILNFANPFWNSPNPERKRQATIAEAMDLAAQNVERELADQPEVQAEIFFILGKAFMGKGDNKTSEKLIRKAIENYERIRGPENLRSMQFRGQLGNQLYLQARFDEAGEEYRKTVEFLRPRRGDDKETNLVLAGALSGLGNIRLLKGDFRQTAELNQEALEIASGFEGDDRRMIPVLLGNLGTALVSLGDLQRAESVLDKGLAELRSRGGAANLDGANLLRELGEISLLRGDLNKAEQRFSEAYEIALKSVGEKNIYTIELANRLVRIYLAQQNFAKADELLSKAESAGKELHPNGSVITAVTRSLRGEYFTRQGMLEKGEAEHRSALEFFNANSKDPNANAAAARHRLGMNLAAQKRFEEARELVRSAYEALLKSRGASHPETVRVKQELEQLQD